MTNSTSYNGDYIHKEYKFCRKKNTMCYILWRRHIIWVGLHKYFPGHMTTGVSPVFILMVKLSPRPRYCRHIILIFLILMLSWYFLSWYYLNINLILSWYHLDYWIKTTIFELLRKTGYISIGICQSLNGWTRKLPPYGWQFWKNLWRENVFKQILGDKKVLGKKKSCRWIFQLEFFEGRNKFLDR